MEADMDTFVTARYVTIDDSVRNIPFLFLYRPKVGIAPKLSGAEPITITVVLALTGFSSETRLAR